MLAPVEYLTYEIRKRRRVFRLPRRAIQVRICIAFFADWNVLCTNQTPGMIQEGGRNPLLGRFKGDCKGGAPARIQRSDSRGKRRNNETDETCRLRQGEGCGVCSDANPPLAFSFYRQRLFLCRAKKKGLKRPSRTPRAKALLRPSDATPAHFMRG